MYMVPLNLAIYIRGLSSLVELIFNSSKQTFKLHHHIHHHYKSSLNILFEYPL